MSTNFLINKHTNQHRNRVDFFTSNRINMYCLNNTIQFANKLFKQTILLGIKFVDCSCLVYFNILHFN